VQHQLHAARVVEEALEQQISMRRQDAERDVRRAQYRTTVSATPSSTRASACTQLEAAEMPPVVSACATAARNRETSSESSVVRAGASPSQNGIVGEAPSASTTRTVPLSTRRIRHAVLPSKKTSPAMLSIAKSSLIVPMKCRSARLPPDSRRCPGSRRPT
jgi:hypothetical protein